MLGQPSRFWESLGATHARDLDQYGLQACKRHQALRYFNWTWRWDALVRSEQMRFLLGHTSPITWMRCATAPAELSDSAWYGVTWPRRDRWLYVLAVRLLWEYARTHDKVGVLAMPEPELGAPLPVYWRGRLISQDLANTALEAATIVSALAGQTPKSIVEVGAGYGRNAYVLLSLFPNASYTIVDIEPAISLSHWYLTQLFDQERLQFLTPDQVEHMPSRSRDLGLSVSSLQEMTLQQVEGYLQLFDRVVAGGIVYLKQWRHWHNPVDRVTLDFGKYPIPNRWQLLYTGTAPVQTGFQEKVWRL